MQVRWKKVSLTALCSAALVSFTYNGISVDAAPSHWTHEVGRHHPILDVLNERNLYKRDIADIWEVCPLDSSTIAGAMFLHFTAIFFQDFTTGGGTDILGPLAVGGKFTAPNYIVNANRGQDCSVHPTTGLDGVGLVVGGLTETEDTRVHGDSLHAGGGDLNEIRGLDEGEGCAIFDDIGTGVVDFEIAENAAIDASLMLASMSPSLYMDSDGRITDLGNSVSSSFKIFTFNTCNNRDCNVGGILSDPSAIFFGEGNFNGPSGDVPSDEDTVVFNVPVTVGATIELKTNFPSQGFYACRTIYNFYPVNEEGIYVTDGEFTLFRNTGGQIEGFTLAPRGHILDSGTGAFAGTLIGLDYGWYYGTYGVEIHDYGAADDNCNDFAGCFPINVEEPQYSTITVVETPPPTVSTVTTTYVEATEIPVTSVQPIASLPITASLPTDIDELTTITATVTSLYTIETSIVITVTPDPTTMTSYSPLPTTWAPPTTRPTESTTTTPYTTVTTTYYLTTEVVSYGTVYAYPYIEEKKWDKWDKWDKYDDKNDGWGDDKKKKGWKDDKKKKGWKYDKRNEWGDDDDDDDNDDDCEDEWEIDEDWDKDEKWNDNKKWKNKYD